MQEELRTQLAELERRKSELETEEHHIRQAVLAEVRETIRLFQFTEDELRGGTPKKKQAEPMYQSPYDTQTWSGRGRQPNWYRQALLEGYADEDLRIKH